jgi:phosphopantothenoylcysteine decarboxylase / phosphopantothenate---cysteine ligase
VSGRLDGRLIGLGVTGSIAAYKAVELLRLFRAEGADVVVMLTPSATRFVGPLSFEALSRHRVETDPLDLLEDGRIGHIVLADAADAIVVAPATAHWMATMAHGLSGDAISATCLATAAPVVVAPAMDGDMWTHRATRDNVARIRDEFGYTVVAPESGELASGQSGIGRLADLGTVVDALVEVLAGTPIRAPDPAARPPASQRAVDADLDGRHVVVTAGGTREPIDPVRFLGNRSTGRMGAAIAGAARDRGARVTVVAADVDVALPADVTVVRVETAAQLHDALLAVESYDVLVMAAAVADYRPAIVAERKLERGTGMTLELEPTDDILADMARRAAGSVGPRPVLVGFAAETGSLERAAGKLERKGVDLLVANDVSEPGSGFGTETNRVTILSRGGRPEGLPLLPKRDVADRLLDRVVRLLDDRDVDPQTSG